MLKNFIVITIRNLASQRIHAFINIFGLAVGFAAALLISAYLAHELSYDNFHPDADRIYRVGVEGKLRGSDLKIAVTALPMAKKLSDDYPAIESSVRVARFGAWLVSSNNASYNEDSLLFADSGFFRFFDFPFIAGDAATALAKEKCIVLTRSAAVRYFGHMDVLGKKLTLETEPEPYIITGIIEDVPSNSHFHFDMVGSLVTLNKYLREVWVSHTVYTYIKIRSGTDVQKLEEDINKLVSEYVVPQVREYLDVPAESFTNGTNTITYFLQPLRKIHLSSHLDNELESNGEITYLLTFAIIAFLIILIVCLNFINLSTANAANRAREVILRKVVGAERRQIIFQFLTESVLISFLSLVLALLLTEITMPYFNRFLGTDLHFNLLNDPRIVFSIIAGVFLLGLAAGSYPAVFLASFDPVRVLQGVLNRGISNRSVRSVFVVIQLSISIIIITVTWVVFAQVEFMLNKELGFVKERILVVRRPDALKNQIDEFKREILQYPQIESVTNSNSIPGRDFLATTFTLDSDSARDNLLMNQIFVNYDFEEAFQLSMLAGRFFSPEIASDSIACVINEEALKLLGNKEVLGSFLLSPTLRETIGGRLEIIGVVKNFHFESVDKKIEPLVFTLMPGNWEGYLNVRLSSMGIDKSINYLEDTWKKYTSDYPFQYFFLDQDFDKNYRSVVRTGKLLFIFALLSVFLACLGLFGLVLFTTNRRIREIGIRKAVGATNTQIILLLVKETAILNIYASVFAWVMAYLVSQLWLKDFYSRIKLSPHYFVFSSLLVLALSILVVFYQAWTGSRSDPSEALKAE
jgi:putative ABC transport system permease protein